MPKNLMDLSGRVAVVIGGNSGLGKAIALGLAEAGADVVPTGRRLDATEQACGEVEALGRRTLCHTADVTSRKSLTELRDAVLAAFGRVDTLVNVAGTTSRKPTQDVPEEEWLRLFDINVHGAFRACQLFFEPLKASGRGRIINITSIGAFIALHEVTAYCASKAALLQMTRNLGCEWVRYGIHVNAIAPGVFPTELNASLLTGTARGDEFLQRTPAHRFGKPEELVGAAILLASDAASYMTGECINVDGGYLASAVNS